MSPNKQRALYYLGNSLQAPSAILINNCAVIVSEESRVRFGYILLSGESRNLRKRTSGLWSGDVKTMGFSASATSDALSLFLKKFIDIM
ncbi:hypothetical protein BPAE_0015g00380 [Botrytis paeoniae]|uniref:Uncharacterized protein n=1 Tax=Botrytis paeoniae TaxID=278948 RepID=A0A4Z1FX39_9HELO|nr:hypothetical protein BPAE_0015g00380 [Botrytis paeoniae]